MNHSRDFAEYGHGVMINLGVLISKQDVLDSEKKKKTQRKIIIAGLLINGLRR